MKKLSLCLLLLFFGLTGLKADDDDGDGGHYYWHGHGHGYGHYKHHRHWYGGRGYWRGGVWISVQPSYYPGYYGYPYYGYGQGYYPGYGY